MALLNTSLLKQLLPKKLIGPASLSYGNKKKRKIKTGILHTIYLIHKANLKDIRPT